MTSPTIDDAIAAADAQATNNKPVQTFRDRGVSVSIFPCAYRREDGAEATFHTAVVERSYKDRDGEFRASSSFAKEHLLTLRRLVDKALDAMDELETEQRAARRG